jgi:hypothetical protein
MLVGVKRGNGTERTDKPEWRNRKSGNGIEGKTRKRG